MLENRTDNEKTNSNYENLKKKLKDKDNELLGQ